ncbi:MAG: hypothetical protein JNL64_14815 [Blastocatellia bacterium]|nr:hypothetical protein [Blastocatellia bacterium]
MLTRGKIVLLIAVMVCLTSWATAQTSSFTYQGKLTDSNINASGAYDLVFKLFDQPTGGSQIGSDFATDDVNVVSGVFSVTLDFGTAAFTNGSARYLQIEVRTGASSGAYTVLTPRQLITSAPHAIKSLNADTATTALTAQTSANMALLGSLRWDLLRTPATFAVGTNPIACASDGTNIWVVNNGAGNVTKLRASDGTNLGTFTVRNDPRSAAFDGSYIWVTNRGNSNVTKLRASDGVSLGNFPVSLPPSGIAFDGANMWVTHSAGSVTKLRASDAADLGTFPVGSQPIGVAFDGNNIWVSDSVDQRLYVVRPVDGAVVSSFVLGIGSLRDVAFDGNNIWVLKESLNQVVKIRASDGAILTTVGVGIAPNGIAFDGSHIWVSNSTSNTVTKIFAHDGTVVGTYNVGSSPRGVCFDGSNIWVTNFNSNTVSKITTFK